MLEMNLVATMLEDDEDMLEAGEDYEAILSVPFRMVKV
jgi:hypothetical protein